MPEPARRAGDLPPDDATRIHVAIEALRGDMREEFAETRGTINAHASQVTVLQGKVVDLDKRVGELEYDKIRAAERREIEANRSKLVDTRWLPVVALVIAAAGVIVSIIVSGGHP